MNTESEVKAYFSGVQAGIIQYAHWKDGIQHVGTTGRLLKDALIDVDIEREKVLENIRTEVKKYA